MSDVDLAELQAGGTLVLAAERRQARLAPSQQGQLAAPCVIN